MKLETLWTNEFGNKETANDFAGRKIRKNELGKKTTYGCDSDHILPKKIKEINSIENLQIVHWKTNKEKADKPSFVISDEYGANEGNYQVKRKNKTTEDECKKIPYNYSNKKYAVVKLDDDKE